MSNTVDNPGIDAIKRKFLSLVERIKVIEINNKNRSACKIVEDLGVYKTQVQNILKRKEEGLEEYENDISGARKRLCRTSENEWTVSKLDSRCSKTLYACQWAIDPATGFDSFFVKRPPKVFIPKERTVLVENTTRRGLL